jgi:HEAT repeat protein
LNALVFAALKHSETNIRRHAVEHLSRIKDGRVVLPLITALMDEDPEVQRCAAEALKRLDTPEARSALKDWETKI